MNNQTVNFEFNGKKVKAEFRNATETMEIRRRTWKAYVFGLADPDDGILEDIATAIGAKSIYTSREDFPLLDYAWDAFNKLIVLHEKVYLLEALRRMGINADILQISFSKTCGCSCGCSPGFTMKLREDLEHGLVHGAIHGADIFIHVEEK